MVAEGRDEKGRLVKGHKPTFSGFKPGQNVGGAPKSLTTQIKDALQIAQDVMPQLFLDMINDAQDATISARDRQACREYLADRIYGRPNQPLTNAGSQPLVVFIIGAGYKLNEEKDVNSDSQKAD